MPRFAVSTPVSGRQMAWVAVSASAALTLVALASEALPAGLPIAAGVLAMVAAVLTTAYAVFIRSRLAVLEVARGSVRLRKKSVTGTNLIARPGAVRWRGRSWTIVDIAGGGQSIRVGCPSVDRGSQGPATTPVSAPGLDGIATLDELLEITQAIERPDVTLPAMPDFRDEQASAGRRATVWMRFLIIVGVAAAALPRLVGNSARPRGLATALVIVAISVAFVISWSRDIERSRRRLPDETPRPATHRLAPAIKPGHSTPTASFWGALFGVLAKVAIAMMIPLILFAPAYQVVRAFERHVDVPGCRATCQTHRLVFDSYSWAKTGSICLCRPADHPESWQVFKESYNVLGGQARWAGPLDVVIRAGAALGTFCLGLALILLGLVRLKRARSR